MAQKYKSKWTGPQVDSAVDQITDKIDRSEIGVAGGIASLGRDGKVPSWQLPTAKSVTADNFIGKDGITVDKAADSEKIEISGSGLVPKLNPAPNYFSTIIYSPSEKKYTGYAMEIEPKILSVPYRDGNKANFKVGNLTADDDGQYCTNKKYVDDNFVKIPSPAPTNWSVLVYEPGQKKYTTYPMEINVSRLSVPYRDYDKQNFKVGDLTADDDGQYCANKKYVDEAVAGVAESVSRYKHHVKFTFVSSTYNGSFFTDIYSNQNTVIDSLATLKTYLGDEFTKDLYGYLEYSNAYRLGNLITDTTVFYIQNGVGTQSISNFTISDTVTTI